MVRIGVLAVQGAFLEHEEALGRAFAVSDTPGEAVQVRTVQQAARCDGLIMPGGESTTIHKLLLSTGLGDHLVERARSGTPIMGTCAGAILLAQQGDEQVARTGTKLLALMDTAVDRNAFGRQRESFEAPIAVPSLGDAPLPGVFIRAPAFRSIGPEATVWATLGTGETVGVRQGNLLALTFHPELSPDTRIHEHFIAMVAAERDRRAAVVTREAVEAALRTVMDPELPLSIVDMGLVYDVRVSGPDDARRIEVDVTFTAMGCPAMGLIRSDILEALEPLGAAELEVRTVWDPPWTIEQLSDEAREMLRVAGVAV